MADPENEMKQKAVEDAEEKFSASEDYNTFKEKGEKQADYLKAMDFMDILCPRFRYFNVCRARTGWNPKTGTHA
eukprot:9715135-Lingulodinium_polyedra.AAC.1